MTKITGFVPPTRRLGELGVHSVDHFSFSVPDLKTAERFYRAFGLEVREEENGLGLYTVGNEHRWICVSPGSVKKSNYIFIWCFRG